MPRAKAPPPPPPATYINCGASIYRPERKGCVWWGGIEREKEEEEEEDEVVHRALQQQKASVSSGVITGAGQNFN